jgi:hypothetical protein
MPKPTLYRPDTKKRSHTAPYALQYETFCPSTGRSSYAYPHWPSGDSLSANSSPSNRCAHSGAHAAGTGATSVPQSLALPSSKISDEDLEGLDFSNAPQPPCNLESLAEMPVGRPLESGGISWSQVGGQTAAPTPEPRRRRLPPPPAGYMMHRDSSRRGGKRSPSRQRGNDSAIC